MQLLVIFYKHNRKLIAAMEVNTIITEANVLKTPDVDYLITSRKDIFYTNPDGQYYVEVIK